MADDQVSKINLELNASVKNLADLQDAEKRIAALIAAYRKLSEAAEAGQKAATASGSKSYSAGLDVSRELGNARASLDAIDDISKNLPGGLAKAGPAGKELANMATGLKEAFATIASPSGPGSAKAVGETIGQAARYAEQKVSRLSESLDELQRLPKASGKKGVPADPGGKLAQAEKLVRDLQHASGRVSTVTETQKEFADFKGKKTAAQDSAKAAGVEATAKKETAKASTVTAKATKEIAASSEKIATAAKATTAATKETVKASPKKVAADVAKAAAVPTNQPAPAARAGTRLSQRVPAITDASIQRDLARVNISGRKGPVQAEAKLDKVAASADKAAAGLDRVGAAAKSTTEPDLIARRVRPAGQRTPEAVERYAASQANTRWGRRSAGASGSGADGAAQGTRRAAQAAAQFSDSANRAARSAKNLSNGFRSISASSGAATAGIQRVAKSQDAIFGSIKNVLGMAAGYQVLQGIATELGQVFGHLTGGIIGFNAMVEQSTVGFTTLFKNQADQAYAAADGLNQQQVELLDATKKIDFIRQGYTDAGGAAEGMIETVREFANVTPFRFGELNESALRMRAFGFELDEVLKKNPETQKFEGGIVAVGNAVSALGGGADAFRRITYALGQMKQAGRVYQNDMMQLANAGIGGYKYIAAQLMREITTDGSGSRDKVKAQHAQLFSQLESNAIETVRRLTTSGKISGEAAARAILTGLEKDFGGGMEAQAKTFQGAFSTVADTSQSLVADAFKPMFESIRDTTYALGMFLQKDEVRKRAKDFGKVITEVTAALSYIGKVVLSVVTKSFGDLQKVIKSVGDESNKMGGGLSLAFGGLFKGIITIVELLKNDLVRQLVYAGALTKALFAFGAANPLLTQIMLITTAVGVLADAYKNNTAGFRDAMQSMAASVEPLLVAIRDHIVPLVGEMAAAFSSAVFGVIIVGLEAIMPALEVVIDAITAFLRLIATFKGPIAVLGTALAGAFVFNKIVVGFAAISRGITDLIFKFDRLAVSARAASQGMVLLPGATTPVGGNIRMIGPAGPSMPARQPVTAGSVLSGMANRGVGVGMAGMLAGTAIQGLAGDNKDAANVGSMVSNVSSAVFALGALKSVVPAGAFGTAVKGMKDIGSSIGGLAKIKGGPILNILTKIPLLGGLIGGLAPAFGGLMAALAPLAPVLLAIAAAAAVIYAVGEVQKEERRKETATKIDEINKFNYGRSWSGLKDLSQDEINAVSDVEFAMRGRGGQGAAPTTPAVPSGPYGTQTSTTSAPTSGYLSTLNQMATTLEDPAEVRAEMVEKYGERAVVHYERLISKEKEMIALQKQWRDGRLAMGPEERETERIAFIVGERNSYIASQLGRSAENAKATKDQMDLLVNATERAAGSTDTLNWKLNKVKQQYAQAVQLLQTLAEGALQDLLNPDSMVNPYTGLEEAGLTMEEIMQTEQEMGFAQFENQSGLTRSFEEYRDILQSIKPLTDADMVNGKISLKAVERRMSIEKERRKELERIRALAEAEYDIGLATLEQYDESVDPLQRAVNLRKAQKKYAEDIEGLQFGGIGSILDEAKASDEWTAATRATKARLEDFKKGQQMILQEMTNMFNQYNEDVANILSNPKLSAKQRVDAVKLRLEKLHTDLEKNFGITKVMLNTQLTSMNSSINGTLAQLGNPTMPDINWGGPLAAAMEKGGFGVLSDYLTKKAVRVAELTNQVVAAANPGDMVDKMAITNRKALRKLFGERIDAMAKAHFAGRAPGFVEGASRNLSAKISAFEKATKYSDILNLANEIDTLILKYGGGKFAKGGQMRSGRIGLVGEQGPELFIPRSSGMVLNNSISSRLMGMLGGAGSSGAAGNVTININNPVIRNENDIRKLAQEISRVQASQFRTEGGRL